MRGKVCASAYVCGLEYIKKIERRPICFFFSIFCSCDFSFEIGLCRVETND